MSIRFEIYTDASSYNNGRKDPTKNQHSYSVGILVYNRKVLASVGSFNPNTTNNYGELFAIYLSLLYFNDFLKDVSEPYEIDVYSDSQLCVYGLTRWIHGWKKNTDKNGIWYSSNGVVSNQEIFKLIDKNFLSKGNTNIFHIRGHMNKNSSKDLKKAKATFLSSNKFLPSDEKLNFIIDMNNICDRYAVLKLRKVIEGMK